MQIVERKKIAKVEPRWHDHLLLIFEDGTQTMIQRAEHRSAGHSHQEASKITGYTETTVHHLKAGDWYPPMEKINAVDTSASQVPVEQGQPTVEGPAPEDAGGTPPQSGDGTQAPGQQSTQKESAGE